MSLKLITILLFFICCTKPIEPADCLGVPGGNAIEDNCGICDNDLSNDCVQDCNGEWGGNDILDNNGSCCSNWQQDDCNYCNSTNYFTDGLLPNGDCTCSGDVLDECGVCAGNGSPCLNFSIESAPATLAQDDTLNITIQIDNAENLYAVSFKLEYINEMFVPLDENAISIGTLFSEPFHPSNPAFIQVGEISVAIAEMGTVSPIISGSACIIKLIALQQGISSIVISSLEMIDSDGDYLEGLSTTTVDTLSVTVFGD